MRIAKQIKQEKCMGCGKPVTSGFFCARCVDEGAQDAPKPEGWIKSRFTEERRKRVERQWLKEDLMRWSKRLCAVAASGVVFLGGWHFFGDRIQQEYREAANVVRPHDRTDPSKKPVDLTEKGNPAGSDNYSHKHNK
jgi:hypothetical protein